MKKSELQELVDRRLSQRKIAEEIGCSQVNVRYWLRKYGLKTYAGAPYAGEGGGFPRCASCGEVDAAKFAAKNKSYCRACRDARNTERQRANREKILDHMGRRCSDCGFDVPFCLDLHHLDPNDKDVGASHIRSWKWERIEREIAKCILLCKNCHAIRHENERKFSPRSSMERASTSGVE